MATLDVLDYVVDLAILEGYSGAAIGSWSAGKPSITVATTGGAGGETPKVETSGSSGKQGSSSLESSCSIVVVEINHPPPLAGTCLFHTKGDEGLDDRLLLQGKREPATEHAADLGLPFEFRFLHSALDVDPMAEQRSWIQEQTEKDRGARPRGNFKDDESTSGAGIGASIGVGLDTSPGARVSRSSSNDAVIGPHAACGSVKRLDDII